MQIWKKKKLIWCCTETAPELHWKNQENETKKKDIIKLFPPSSSSSSSFSWLLPSSQAPPTLPPLLYVCVSVQHFLSSKKKIIIQHYHYQNIQIDFHIHQRFFFHFIEEFLIKIDWFFFYVLFDVSVPFDSSKKF